jgi:hypothetical protein
VISTGGGPISHDRRDLTAPNDHRATCPMIADFPQLRPKRMGPARSTHVLRQSKGKYKEYVFDSHSGMYVEYQGLENHYCKCKSTDKQLDT